MNNVADIKRFVLRALAKWELPVPQPQLERLVNEGFTPRPLVSDTHQALRELEGDGFIQGAKDDLDEKLVTWSLTTKGTHRAKQLA